MSLSLEGRRFAQDDRVLAFREDREGTVTATWSSPHVAAGSLTGRRDGADLVFGFTQVERSGIVTTGDADARLEEQPDGSLRLHETWRVAGASGHAVLDELPGPRWVRTRVAVPTRDLDAALRFYGGVLGLAVDGPHPAAPYDLAFVTLPGGTQLELTAGGELPLPATGDDLLVLYVPARADLAAVRELLAAAGLELVRPANDYWVQTGVTVRDPDGRLVVVAHLPA